MPAAPHVLTNICTAQLNDQACSLPVCMAAAAAFRCCLRLLLLLIRLHSTAICVLHMAAALLCQPLLQPYTWHGTHEAGTVHCDIQSWQLGITCVNQS